MAKFAVTSTSVNWRSHCAVEVSAETLPEVFRQVSLGTLNLKEVFQLIPERKKQKINKRTLII